MTRAEAIEAFEGVDNPGSLGTNAWIDRFVALGMLNLDEPKSGWDIFVQEMSRAGYKIPSSIAMRDISAVLDRAGLKIVEK